MGKTIYTSIAPQLKKKLLIRGTLLGGIGVSFLLIFSIFSSELFLSKWGLSIFFFAFGCIALGMIPLRKVQRIETVPHKLHIDQAYVSFEDDKAAAFTILRKEVLTSKFLYRGERYGIEIITKKLERFFFPYFSKSSANTFFDYLMDSKESDE